MNATIQRQREMSRAQFKAALKKNGFRSILGCWFEDTTGQCDRVSWGALIGPSGLLRRATLAKIVRERRAEVAKREASQ